MLFKMVLESKMVLHGHLTLTEARLASRHVYTPASGRTVLEGSRVPWEGLLKETR